MTKTVSFVGGPEQEHDRNGKEASEFKTWPRSSIKPAASPSQAPSEKPVPTETSEQDMNEVVNNIYNRFRGLSGIDISACLGHLLAGKCDHKLESYSVLNTLMKEMEEANGSPSTAFEPEEVEKTLNRAIADFDDANKSGDVRDTWTLQQIMRSMEQVWARSPYIESGPAVDAFRTFSQRCISLIEQKPGSKTLLSPAIRVANVALDRKLLPTSVIVELINALSRSHFLFASSFITEAMLILSTAHRSCIDALNDSESAWVPLAVRALGSSSSLTRNLALQLIQYHASTLPTPDSPGLLAASLMQPSETHRPNSEPLYRVMVRKMASLSALSYDDAKVIVQAWAAVLQSAFYTDKEWPLLDIWMDIVRVAFSKWPKTITNAWDTILDAQRVHYAYNTALVAPLVATQYSDDSPSAFAKMMTEAVTAAAAGFEKSQLRSRSPKKSLSLSQAFSTEIWDDVLEPTFKSLASGRPGTVLLSWAQLLDKQTIELAAANVPKYLEILSLLLKQATQLPQQQQQQQQQQLNNFELIWMNCIIAGTSSRQKIMDLVKFHYSSLSQLSHNQTLALMFTNRLIAHLPPVILTEKPKNSAFEYLTLILLPVVTFMSTQGDYVDRVLSSCKSEKTMRIMLRALLSTVDTGSDSQINNKSTKWTLAAKTIKEYAESNTDHDSVHLIGDTLLTFIPLMPKATTQQWQLWKSLLCGNKECQSRVLSHLKKLPPAGLQIVLSLPKAAFREEKIRLVRTSFSDEVLTMLQNQTDPPLLDTEMLDSIARALISQNKYESAKWAVKLLSTNRRFVIAKPLLQAIEDTNNDDLVELWNQQVEPHLKTCPPFVPKTQATRLNQEMPQLKIGWEIIIKPSAVKRSMETPPHASNSKRPRRPILTGSVQPTLFTPPASSDLVDGSSPSRTRSLGDDLCSSPPPRSSTPSMGSSLPQTWKNSQDRARTLKRVMMGFDMAEASQTMKRSEMQMIYNLMFKSCVWLKTHLAETGSVIPEDEVEAAKEDLERNIELRKALQAREDIMIENGKRRAQEGPANGQDSCSDDDDLPSDELDLDDFDPINEIKMEVV